jgi:hypothetical protein
MKLGMSVDDRVEIGCLSDHHLAADDRLDAIFGRTAAGQYAFTREAQGDDLPPARRIRLELRQDTGTDEHHLVARRTLLSERPPRLNQNNPVRDIVEKIGEMGLEPRGN